MPDIQRVGDLEIAEDMPFQERFWKIERAGWLLLCLGLLLAALGFTGSGPFNEASVEVQGLRVEYSRFARLQTTDELRLYLQGVTVGEVPIRLSRSLWDDQQIDGVEPEPERAEAGPDYVTLSVRAAPGGLVKIWVKPQRLGPRSGTVRIGDGPAVPLSQFIYP